MIRITINNRTMLLCALSLFVFCLCGEQKSATDITQISKANAFITAKDIKGGTQKTSNSMSAVVLSHQKHKNANITCITCHHKKYNDSRIKKCAYCHKGLQGTVLMHKMCIDCHTAKKNGPVTCITCHPRGKKNYLSKAMRDTYKNTFTFTKMVHKKHVSRKVQCKLCHHKDHDKTSQQKCSACHQGRSQMKIMHYFCKDCHKGNNTLKRKAGPLTCSGCHKKQQ